MSSSTASYPVKRVRFEGRQVPILLQDINGPCPLIALANVLFLRGKVELPAGVGEVATVSVEGVPAASSSQQVP